MIEAIISGLTLGILLAISVGPVIFAIIKQSLINGHKGGYAFVAGVSASDIAFVLVCNMLTQLFQQALSHKTTIGVCGSIFLIMMGIYAVFFKKPALADSVSVAQKTLRRRDVFAIAASGFFMNTLNPGAFIFWLAATAKINAQAQLQQYPHRYLITVFGICLAFVLSTDIAKVLLAGKIRNKLTPHNIHIINRISGLILIGFGIALIWGLMVHN